MTRMMITRDPTIRKIVRYGAVTRCRYSISSSDDSGMIGHRRGHCSRLAMFRSTLLSQAARGDHRLRLT
jgi:hypothetical protein